MASPRAEPESTPICRCRVLYLGSAVPHVTKDGLQGIQEPLRELYPEQGALGARGIDSWLSVWSNGLLLENVDENHKKVTRFFPIDSLHYCAAVRYVLVPEKAGGGGGSGGGAPTPRFLPLDSPFARTPNPSHPPLFAAILRRTSGIKVLECHAFICKREMAANALVRCCFHAYADSSYARHMDGVGGSNYGTLRSHNNDASVSNNNTPSGTLDKVDGWRRLGGAGAGAGAGSTLSLNSHQNHNGTLTSNATMSAAVDDVSIYNGDENHKVWVGSGGGSVVDREELYGGSYTMRSSRSTRPRQVVAPVNAPPPPPTPKDEKSKKLNAAASANNTKERTRRKKQLGGSREELFPMMNGGGGSLMRGAGRSASSMSAHHYSNGTLMRPTSAAAPHPHQVNGFHHPHHYHPHQMPPPPMLMATLPGRPHHKQQQQRVVAGTFSHRPPSKGGMIMNGRPIIPAPFVAIPHPHPVPIISKKKHHHVEEPIYMPSARPLSPVASFQPGHFPHEAYLMQQYANNTMDHGNSKKKKGSKSEGKHSGKKVMGPPAIMVNGGGPVSVPVDDEEIVAPPPVIVVEESPFNTGIYRKKGHLNERAFSYSIRQEHRSRSYGSLANLKFAGPEVKKEREIAQMMHDLELSGDDLERSEVPPPAALRANSRR